MDGWIEGAEDYKKDCLWCIFVVGGHFRFFFLGRRGVSFCFFSPSIRHCWEINTYARAHHLSIITYPPCITSPSRLHQFDAQSGFDAHIGSIFTASRIERPTPPLAYDPPIAHAARNFEARSRLAVSLPQRPVPFEVVPNYHQMNHGSGQRIFLPSARHFDTLFLNN